MTMPDFLTFAALSVCGVLAYFTLVYLILLFVRGGTR